MAMSTMRRAFRTWQSWQQKLSAAQADVNHHYLALLNKAAVAPSARRQGLLRHAAAALVHPMDPETLQLHQRLAHAFAFLGRGFCRRAPAALQVDIRRYSDRLHRICTEFDHLSHRLALAGKMFDILLQPKKPARHYLRWTLSDPENVRLTLLLQERRRLLGQRLELAYQQSWKAKLSACQNWLKLLQSTLPAAEIGDLQQLMQELPPFEAGGAVPLSRTAFQQLDLCLDLGRRLSLEDRQGKRT